VEKMAPFPSFSETCGSEGHNCVKKKKNSTMLPQAKPAFGSGTRLEQSAPRNSCCLPLYNLLNTPPSLPEPAQGGARLRDNQRHLGKSGGTRQETPGAESPMPDPLVYR